MMKIGVDPENFMRGKGGGGGGVELFFSLMRGDE